MDRFQQQVEAFFRDYAERTNNGLKTPPEIDLEATAGAFAEHFIEANPAGVSCGENNDDFRAAIPKGLEFYRSIGTQRMTVDSLDVTPLDDFHVMAKVHWKADYRKQDGSPLVIDFDVIYFLQRRDEQLKVFAYISGDEQQTYVDHGLVPASETNEATH